MADFKPHICGDNNLFIPSVCDEEGAYFDGLTDRTITQGTDFDLTSGVTAYDSDGNITTYSVSPTEVDCCEVGTQTFTYSSAEVTETREITVIQASDPTFSGLTALSIGVGDTVDTLDGVTATDALGQSVTVTCTQGGSVTYGVAGDYTLNYTATDDCGNVGTATRSVHVGLGYFVGVVDAAVNQGVGFDLEAGVTAYDEGGNVVPYTYSPSEIDECEVGNQTVTYTATGVESASRVITVNGIASPTISGASSTLTVGSGENFDPLTGVTGTDGNGNSCTVTATLNPVTYRTVIYTDGTMIINEPSNMITANVASHGSAVNVYAPLDEDNDYVFASNGEKPWVYEYYKPTSVEFGSPVAPTSMAHWFRAMNNVTSFDWTNLDTSNLTSLGYTFMGCSSLQTLDLTSFDTSNVTSMGNMLMNCNSLTSVDLSSFDTSNVISMVNMFYDCEALTSVDVSNFDTSNVATMAGMFQYCFVLASLSLCSFDTSSATNMSYMFDTCRLLETINVSDDFITGQVTSSNYMFNECLALVGGNGTTYNANYTDKTYAVIDTANEVGYFTDCSSTEEEIEEIEVQ